MRNFVLILVGILLLASILTITACSNDDYNEDATSERAYNVEGRLLRGRDDILLIVDELPVILANADKYDFSAFKSGDFVSVMIDGISESWPGIANVWSDSENGCVLIQEGTIDDISMELLLKLEDAGFGVIEAEIGE